MSRTYKDKPYKHGEHYKSWKQDLEEFQFERNGFKFYGHIYNKTTKPKKRKEQDTEDHWMATPMWWIRLLHTRPERRRVNVALSQVSDVEEVDIPDLGRKPHWYFW